jgi:hypothetical protein
MVISTTDGQRKQSDGLILSKCNKLTGMEC